MIDKGLTLLALWDEYAWVVSLEDRKEAKS